MGIPRTSAAPANPAPGLFRFRSSTVLVCLLALGQLGCLVIGVAWFVRHADGIVDHHAREHRFTEQRALADAVAQTLDCDGDAELAAVVRHFTQTHAGGVAILDRTTGRTVDEFGAQLHGLGSAEVGSLAVRNAGRELRVGDVGSDGARAASGVIGGGADAALATVLDVPESNARILILEPESHVAAASRRVVSGLFFGGVLVSLGVAAFAALLALAIVQRFESRVALANEQLEALVALRSDALLRARDAVIFGLARLAESRDDDTGEHLERIRVYAELLANQIAKAGGEVDDAFVRRIGLTSSLHDIGKVGVPDAILLKPGALTPPERRIMQRHTTIGGDCLMAIRERLPDDPFIEMACQIAFAHHERWDGKGYPFGLKGKAIPLAARIVALADVYDALTTVRVYKPAMSHDEAREIIVRGAGTHFDPEIVEAFLAVERQFRELAAHVEPSLLIPRPPAWSPMNTPAVLAIR